MHIRIYQKGWHSKLTSFKKLKKVQGSPRVMIANCYREHTPFGPALRGFNVSAFRLLHVSFEQDIAYFVDLIPGTNALSTFIVNL